MDAKKRLSLAEKLGLNQMIREENNSIPAEHQDLVNERIRKAKDNPGELLDWDTASKSLRP